MSSACSVAAQQPCTPPFPCPPNRTVPLSVVWSASMCGRCTGRDPPRRCMGTQSRRVQVRCRAAERRRNHGTASRCGFGCLGKPGGCSCRLWQDAARGYGQRQRHQRAYTPTLGIVCWRLMILRRSLGFPCPERGSLFPDHLEEASATDCARPRPGPYRRSADDRARRRGGTATGCG